MERRLALERIPSLNVSNGKEKLRFGSFPKEPLVSPVFPVWFIFIDNKWNRWACLTIRHVSESASE